MRRTLALTVLGGFGLIAGCSYDTGSGYYGSGGGYGTYDPGTDGTAPAPAWEGDPADYGEELDVRDARMTGSLGDVRGFDEEPYRVQAVRIEGIDFVRLDATDRATGMWVMAQVEVQGGLDQDTFAPGASIDSATPTSGVYMSGIGCSGPEEGNFTFDMTPSNVQVQVQEGSQPGTRDFTFQLDFGSGHATEIRFELGPTATVGPVEARTVEVTSATLSGTVDGTAVDGDATYLSELHSGEHSTVLVERTEWATGETVRLRLDVDGGLAPLAVGTHELGGADFVTLVASGTSFEADPGYPRSATHLLLTVREVAGERQLEIEATLDSGEALTATLTYAIR